MYGTLIPQAGGAEIPLLKTTVTVGRHPSSDILLHFANVSVKHCQLRFEDGVWNVVDLGSSNGVRVNGVKIVGSGPLLPGDELTIARHHHFRIEYKSEKAARLASQPDREENVFGTSLLEKAGLKKPSAGQNRQQDS